MWYGMGWWGWLMMVTFWVLAVLLIVWAVRSSTASGSTEPKEKDPRGILDERFARGEIDSEEYLQRRAVLETHRQEAEMSARPLRKSGGVSPQR